MQMILMKSIPDAVLTVYDAGNSSSLRKQVLLCIFLIFHQKTLKKKPGDEPAGSVVQTDYLGEIPFRVLIIPRTQIAPAQP